MDFNGQRVPGLRTVSGETSVGDAKLTHLYEARQALEELKDEWNGRVLVFR